MLQQSVEILNNSVSEEERELLIDTAYRQSVNFDTQSLISSSNTLSQSPELVQFNSFMVNSDFLFSPQLTVKTQGLNFGGTPFHYYELEFARHEFDDLNRNTDVRLFEYSNLSGLVTPKVDNYSPDDRVILRDGGWQIITCEDWNFRFEINPDDSISGAIGPCGSHISFMQHVEHWDLSGLSIGSSMALLVSDHAEEYAKFIDPTANFLNGATATIATITHAEVIRSLDLENRSEVKVFGPNVNSEIGMYGEGTVSDLQSLINPLTPDYSATEPQSNTVIFGGITSDQSSLLFIYLSAEDNSAYFFDAAFGELTPTQLAKTDYSLIDVNGETILQIPLPPNLDKYTTYSLFDFGPPRLELSLYEGKVRYVDFYDDITLAADTSYPRGKRLLMLNAQANNELLASIDVDEFAIAANFLDSPIGLEEIVDIEFPQALLAAETHYNIAYAGEIFANFIESELAKVGIEIEVGGWIMFEESIDSADPARRIYSFDILKAIPEAYREQALAAEDLLRIYPRDSASLFVVNRSFFGNRVNHKLIFSVPFPEQLIENSYQYITGLFSEGVYELCLRSADQIETGDLDCEGQMNEFGGSYTLILGTDGSQMQGILDQLNSDSINNR